ncbi:hypothetical protein D3C81_1421480 [compost metagenome]
MEQQALASGGHLFGDAGEDVVGVDAEPLGRFDLRGSEFIPDPAEEHPAVVNRTADDPVLLGQRVTEDPAFGIDERLVRYGTDGSARTDGCGNDAWPDGAYAEIGEHAVARADNKRRLRQQADFPGDFRRQPGRGIGGRYKSGQPTFIDTGDVQRPRVPFQTLQIQHAGGRGDGVVDDIFPEELGKYIFLDGDEFGCLPEHFGLVLAQPHELRNRRHGVDGRTGPQVELVA